MSTTDRDPMTPVLDKARLKRIATALRERRVPQTVILYAGSAWIVIQVIGFFVSAYDLSRKLLDVAVWILAVGFPAAIVVAWFHGARGRQRAPRLEATLLVLFLVAAGIGSWRIATAEEPPEPGAPPEAAYDLGERSIAVLPFRHSFADPELDWLGGGLAELLTTDLAQLDALRVVSGQRLYDLLRQAGGSELREIPDSMATSVATRSGARLVARGSILGAADDLTVNVSLVRLADGQVVAAARDRGSDVFRLVERISGQLIAQLLDTQSARTDHSPLEALATGSLEAYRAYQEGLTADRRLHLSEARTLYRRAIAIDPGFALAHFRLGTVLFRMGIVAEAVASVRRAEANLTAASERDRLLIGGTVAVFEGDPGLAEARLRELLRKYPDDKEARLNLRHILEMDSTRTGEAETLLREIVLLDPYYAPAYNELAYVHAGRREFDTAQALIERYVELEPGEPNPLDSQGEIRELAGDFDAARAAYRAALRLDPSFTTSLDHLVRTYLLESRPGAARSELEDHRADRIPETRSRAALLRGDTWAWEGRFDTALAAYAEAASIAADAGLREMESGALGSLVWLAARLERHGLVDSTVARLRRLDPLDPDALYAGLLSLGYRDRIEAMEEVREEVERMWREEALPRVFAGPTLASIDAQIAFHRGDHERAVEKATIVRQATGGQNPGNPEELLSLILSGRAAEATARAEAMSAWIRAQSRLDPLVDGLAVYLLGRAHEASGAFDEARRAYDALLDRWGASVGRIRLTGDAAERVSRMAGRR